jgi:hypothetical protein
VGGSYDREVAAVESGDLAELQSLGGRNHRSVDGAQGEVPVASDELSDAKPVLAGHGLADQIAGREVAEEADFGFSAEPAGQEVGHFGHDEYGYDQGAGVGFEEFQGFVVVVVVGVDVGIERSGVDNDRYGATSSRRISSIRTETSCEPLWPAAAAIRRRRPAGRDPRWVSIASRVSSDTVTRLR